MTLFKLRPTESSLRVRQQYMKDSPTTKKQLYLT